MTATESERAVLLRDFEDHFRFTADLATDPEELAKQAVAVVELAGWAPTPGRAGILTATIIADRLGLGLSTVVTWYTRYGPSSDHPFPAPDSPMGARRWWRGARWPEIRRWYRAHQKRSNHTKVLRKGYRSRGGVGVWIGQPGSWVNRQQDHPDRPFPAPDLEIAQPNRTVPLWSTLRREEIQDWYQGWLAAQPPREPRQRASHG